MKKERDIQKLEKIAQLLNEALSSLYDIEDQDEIFNSKQAFEVIENYSTFNASLKALKLVLKRSYKLPISWLLDDLLHDLVDYFEDLAFIHEKE